MLQTNPMTLTKAPVASGAHSFMKASCPVPPPLSPITQPSICCPWLWEARREAELAVHWQLTLLILLPLRGSTVKGVGGEEGN